MKNHYTGRVWLIAALFLFLLFTGVVLPGCSNSQSTSVTDNPDEIPVLLERKGQLAKATEWSKTKAKVNELKAKLAGNPSDSKARLQLAMIFMNEARITGDSYYHQASIKTLNQVLDRDPRNFEAIVFKASVAMSLHQFTEAKKLAQQALEINPDNAYVYGVLVDANVELGNYREAIAMSDKMQTLKPSLESYSRASYLREIHGDYSGAINAMSMAVLAGGPGSESAEWARVTLGDLYLNTGKPDSAVMQYETALTLRPQFPNAEIGLAKVEKSRKNYKEAIMHTENAIRMMSEPSFVSLLGELYELDGNDARAKEIRRQVVDLLEENAGDDKKVLMQHNANCELANAYLDNKEYDKALKYANQDLGLRPGNIDANELVAWISYLKGDINSAKAHADKMLVTRTQNANTLYRASLIYRKAGDLAKADACERQSHLVNPYLNKESVLATK